MVTPLERARVFRRMSGDLSVPKLRYRVDAASPDTQEILREFDALLWQEATHPFEGQRRIEVAERISKRLTGALCWDMVHNNFDDPFLQDVLQAALARRLEAMSSNEIGIGLVRGLRDARFLGSASLASLYCESTLRAANRKAPPQMGEVIRLLEVLNGERKLFGPLNGVPWEATLQRLAKTYVVQLPIPAESPEEGDCLPVPSGEPELDSADLPSPAGPAPPSPKTPWRWRR